MITINKTKKFALNNREITDSIFTDKTCIGFYKYRKAKKDYILFDNLCTAIAVIWQDSSGNRHAGNCREFEPGKYFFQAGIADTTAALIGFDNSTYCGNMVEVSESEVEL